MPRYQIYAAGDAMALIDRGAAAAGESRSEFVIRAAVARATGKLRSTGLTKAQRRAIVRALAKFVSEDMEV